jgi:outer membrane immunogenic protein
MRRLSAVLIAAVSTVAFAQVALAADLPRKAPAYTPPPPVWSWSGFYIGAHAGWGWGHDPFTEVFPNGASMDTIEFVIPSVTVSDVHSDGFVGGFQAGYNHQWGNWVGGLEIDLSGTGIKGSTSNSATSVTGPFTCGNGSCSDIATQSATVHDKFDLLGTARARLGYLATPNLLLYGTGGFAWTRFVQETTDMVSTSCTGTLCPIVMPLGQSVTSTTDWRFGWAAGGGAEARLFDSNWLARVEYLHYDFGDSGSFSKPNSEVYLAGGGGYEPVSFTSGHLTVDVVRAGLSYKFGGPY